MTIEIEPFPDGSGLHNLADATGANIDEIRMIILALIGSGQSAEQVADDIEATLPRYKAFAAWLRQNPWFATSTSAAISAILTVALTHLINHPATSPDQITNIIQNQVIIEGGQPAADDCRQDVGAPHATQPSAPPTGAGGETEPRRHRDAR